MTLPDITTDPRLRDLVKRALAEDVGKGDLTTLALVPAARRGRAVIVARGPCVVAGGGVAREVFRQVDAALKVDIVKRDGLAASRGAVVLAIRGRAASILTAERTALNFMQRLTGIATLTQQFVRRVSRYGVTVLDTRKTTPTLRFLEKYAVLCGGGSNHRHGLYDMMLMKDNHRHLWARSARGNLAAAVVAARNRFPGVPIEVEVESEKEVASVLPALPDWILLDNMSPARIGRCVALAKGKCRIEASGGITLDTVEAVAATGVNAISAGCLTHSAPAADLSLELIG